MQNKHIYSVSFIDFDQQLICHFVTIKIVKQYSQKLKLERLRLYGQSN